MKSIFFLVFVFIAFFAACSGSKERQLFIADAERFCEIHKVSTWEKEGKLEALNQLDPTEKLAELTRVIRATVETPEMQKIIFDEGRGLPAEEFYPYLQKAIPELTGRPFDCPAIPEFYVSR
jgi:hypothetical protein